MADVGFIYIFNTLFSPLNLDLNNRRIVGIPSAISGGYPPPFIVLDRNDLQENVESVAVTSNTLAVSYDGLRMTYEIELPPNQYPIEDDVRLYIYDDVIVSLYKINVVTIKPS